GLPRPARHTVLHARRQPVREHGAGLRPAAPLPRRGDGGCCAQHRAQPDPDSPLRHAGRGRSDAGYGGGRLLRDARLAAGGFRRPAARGGDVGLYVPRVPHRWGAHPGRPRSWYWWVRDLARNLVTSDRVTWFDLRVAPRWVWRVRPDAIAPADATVATAWPTAYWVAG